METGGLRDNLLKDHRHPSFVAGPEWPIKVCGIPGPRVGTQGTHHMGKADILKTWATRHVTDYGFKQFGHYPAKTVLSGLATIRDLSIR